MRILQCSASFIAQDFNTANSTVMCADQPLLSWAERQYADST
jgi:hypothetical protein